MQVTLKQARHMAGLTQAEVAEKIGTTAASLCRWEKGNCSPKVTTFFQMCELYGVSPTDIFMPEKSRQSLSDEGGV